MMRGRREIEEADKLLMEEDKDYDNRMRKLRETTRRPAVAQGGRHVGS